MRMTLTIDDDLLERARVVAERTRRPVDGVINEALRAGLALAERVSPKKPYRTVPHAMGLRAGRSLDNIPNLLAALEDEDER